MKTLSTIAVFLMAHLALAQSYSKSELDPQIEKLPPLYIGHSPSDVFFTLKAKKNYLSIQEFETSADYKTRKTREANNKLIGNLRLGDIYAFYCGGFELNYSADHEIFDIKLEDLYTNDGIDFAILSTTKNLGSFVGQNAFGIKRRVRVTRETSLTLQANYALNFPKYLPMKIPEATRSKEYIRLLVLVRLIEPYISEEQSVDEATISSPTTVAYYEGKIHGDYVGAIFYNIKTGEILHKHIPSLNSKLAESATNPFKAEIEPDLQPTILSTARAKYTPEARLARISGTVILNALFRKEGQITKDDIQVVRGLPEGLTESAIQAALQIKFTPAIKNGRPVNTQKKLEYKFELN